MIVLVDVDDLSFPPPLCELPSLRRMSEVRMQTERRTRTFEIGGSLVEEQWVEVREPVEVRLDRFGDGGRLLLASVTMRNGSGSI